MADVRQGLDGRIGNTPLDRRDVCPVNVRFKGKRFLRLPGRMPAFLDPPAEGNRDRGGPGYRRSWALRSHGVQDARPSTDSRRYKLYT